MARKKLLNPRGYLSWTQIDLWSRSPSLYIEQYMYGEREATTGRMAFGSKVALAFENGEDTDMDIEALRAVVPRYKLPEHEIRVPFEFRDGVVDLLGKLDTFDPDTCAFREYKTGTTVWTAGKAQRHAQIDHYTALIWLAHKKMPPTIHLDWAQTEVWNDHVVLTGQVRTFTVVKTVSDVLSHLARCARVAREIDEAYRREIKTNTE